MITRREAIQQMREKIKVGWCLALHGNHDEHECHLKPGHIDEPSGRPSGHECYCGVWW